MKAVSIGLHFLFAVLNMRYCFGLLILSVSV